MQQRPELECSIVGMWLHFASVPWHQALLLGNCQAARFIRVKARNAAIALTLLLTRRNPIDLGDLSFAALAPGSIPVIATKMAILRAINAA